MLLVSFYLALLYPFLPFPSLPFNQAGRQRLLFSLSNLWNGAYSCAHTNTWTQNQKHALTHKQANWNTHKHTGIKSTIAENGQEAVDVVMQRGHLFDIIFIDHTIPIIVSPHARTLWLSFLLLLRTMGELKKEKKVKARKVVKKKLESERKWDENEGN